MLSLGFFGGVLDLRSLCLLLLCGERSDLLYVVGGVTEDLSDLLCDFGDTDLTLGGVKTSLSFPSLDLVCFLDRDLLLFDFSLLYLGDLLFACSLL